MQALEAKFNTIITELHAMRQEMATKQDLAEPRQHIASFRHENHQQHAELCRLLREEMVGRLSLRCTDR